MWPRISNIDSNIEATIKGYANDNLAASKLNAWIRAYSGANQGLILQSNTDFKIFSAAGEGNSIYGNSDRSGAIGKDWNGNTVLSGVGRALRPSPIITSFNSKEGQDQISRTCEFSITCFSLEQLELIQTYFMEPGYSVGVEWGWNTPNSARGIINTSVGQGGILNAIADTTLNNDALSSKRTSTNGEYDIFLGFIVGSTVSNDGENFKVDVKLRGAPALPTYLQSQNRMEVKSSGVEVDEKKIKQPYDDSEITKETGQAATVEGIKAVAERRFKNMFNLLPAFRQTENVKELLKTTTLNDYINFDAVISKKISEFIDTPEGGFLGTGLFGEPVISIDTGAGEVVEVQKDKVFSKNKYIRFGFAIDILNKIGAIDHYQVGNKKISFTINIRNSVIGAFPSMFSTKASKLIIPGFVPNFMEVYFFNPLEVQQENTGRLINSTKAWDPMPAPVGNQGWSVKFVGQEPLNSNGLKEQAFYYGYLRNLYVNFDMFKEKIEQKNKNIREILEDVLNEMSSAVNSFWNFQIVEGEGDNGNIEITVVDENWIGQNPEPEKVKIFKHTGIGSPFLNASLNVSIPADMANKIINERLGNNSQPDMQNIKVGTLFNATTDLFLKKTTPTTEEEDTTEVEGDAELERKKARLAELKAKIDRPGEGYAGVDTSKTEVLDTGNIVYYNKGGQFLYTTTKEGDLVTINGFAGLVNGLTDDETKELTTIAEEIKTSINEAIKNRITSNLDKIDIVPIPPVTFPVEFTVDALHKKIKKFFMIFCYDDTDFFDKMKNYWFDSKLRLAGGTKGLSHPLPIKYSFTILGNSGIRRGDTFNIDGIPAKYKNNGIFQVTEVEHSISSMRWETTVTGQYRQLQ